MHITKAKLRSFRTSVMSTWWNTLGIEQVRRQYMYMPQAHHKPYHAIQQQTWSHHCHKHQTCIFGLQTHWRMRRLATHISTCFAAEHVVPYICTLLATYYFQPASMQSTTAWHGDARIASLLRRSHRHRVLTFVCWKLAFIHVHMIPLTFNFPFSREGRKFLSFCI